MLRFRHRVNNRHWTLRVAFRSLPGITWSIWWACGALAVVAVSAQTTDRARTEAQARRANERLQALQREADGLALQERSLLVELRKLEVTRDLKAEQLRQIKADTETVSRELATIGNQIDRLESQDSESRPALESRMVELYKLGGPGYVRLLLNVADLKEFGRAYRQVSALATLDRQRAIQHRRNLEQMNIARAALEKRRAEIVALQRSASEARAASDRAATERSALIAQIDARRDLTAELASELQTAQQRLQQTLGAIASGAPRAESDAAALPIRPFRGDLDWPVAGRVMTRFSDQAGRVSAMGMQSGIQIGAAEGSSVRAVHDGTVAFAGPFTGFGNLVIVDHGGNTYTLYGQLDTVAVAQGAKIDRGETLGTTGRVLVGVPGMYFEMRVDGKPVDPLEWLKKRS
jgi:septal ring factor EnvC (AmiA/AmiB activator)